MAFQGETVNFFPFEWDESTVGNRNEIQAWGVNHKHEKCFLRVIYYPVSCELQLPHEVDSVSMIWNSTKIEAFIKAYKLILKKRIDNFNAKFEDKEKHKWKTMPDFSYSFHEAKEFYYHQKQNKPFLKLEFKSREDMYTFLEPIKKDNQYDKIIKIEIFEHNFKMYYIHLKAWEMGIHSTRKFLTDINANYTGWFQLTYYNTNHEDKIAKDKYPEYKILWKNVKFLPENKEVPKIRFMSFDIESYSDKEGEFPEEIYLNHAVYMISCVSENTGEPEKRTRTLLTLGKCPLQRKDVRVICCETEEDLILAFIDYIEEDDPDILTGFNILRFDWKYLKMRATKYIHPWNNPWSKCSRLKLKESEDNYCKHNQKIFMCNKCSLAPFKTKDMNSNGRGENKFYGVEIKGRMTMVDMYVIIKVDHKLPQYNLNYVSKLFLQEGKREVTANEMFKIYENIESTRKEFEKKQSKINKENYLKAQFEYARVGDYCIQDSELVNKLFVKLNGWIWMYTQGGIYGVNPQNVYLYGQQKRGISLFYEECNKNNIIMTDRKIGKIKYKGGYVSEPKRGVHKAFCIDYNSLYPNTARRRNIDYTTLIPKYNTMEYAISFAKERGAKYNFLVEGRPCEHCLLQMHTGQNFFCPLHEGEFIQGLLDTVPTQGELEDPNMEIIMWKEDLDIDKTPNLPDEYDEHGKKKKRKKVTVKETHYHIFMFAKPTEVVENGKKVVKRGIYPTLAEKLIAKRKEVRAEQKNFHKESLEFAILEQRQLALKLVANSMYGFLGRGAGNFLFPEGAMAITAWGRQEIIKMGNHLVKRLMNEDADLVYGDTDSVMIELLNMKNYISTGNKEKDEREFIKMFMSRKKEFEDIANEINIDPMHGEFEKGMHGVWFQKKMYAYFMMKDDGSYIMEEKTEKDENGKTKVIPSLREKGYFRGQHLENLITKGLPLARREDDFFKLDVYEACLRNIMKNPDRESIKQIMTQIILGLMTRQVPVEDLTMISSVKSHYEDDSNKLKVFSDHRSKIGKPIIGGERYSLIVCLPKENEIPYTKLKVGQKLRGTDEYEENKGSEHQEEIDYLYYVKKAKRADETYNLLYEEDIQAKIKRREERLEKEKLKATAITILCIIAEVHPVILNLFHLVEKYPQKIIDFSLGLPRCKTKTENICKEVRRRLELKTKYAFTETETPILQIYDYLILKKKLMKEIKALREKDIEKIEEDEKIKKLVNEEAKIIKYKKSEKYESGKEKITFSYLIKLWFNSHEKHGYPLNLWFRIYKSNKCAYKTEYAYNKNLNKIFLLPKEKPKIKTK